MDIMVKRNLADGSLEKYESASDKFIKYKIMQGAIKLMRKNVATRAETENIGCYNKLLPPSEETEYEYLADIKAKYLYEILLGTKKGELMTLGAFAKLGKCFKTLNRTRLELLFRRVVSAGKMDLDSFFVVL